MAITVKDILLLETMKDCKVVAGIDGLNREVKAVAIGEIPDIGNWLHGGDFVHTTAWFMREKSEIKSDVGKWVRNLVKNGAAALGIKTKRFINDIPQIIIDIGNELAFPILELPGYSTQASINEGIMNLIMNYQAEVLRRNKEIQDCLMETMINGEGLKDVADMITKLIGNPVLIENSNFKLLAFSFTTEESRELLAVRRSEEFLSQLKERYSSIKREDLEDKKNKMLEKMHIFKMELRTENVNCMQITVPILVTEKLYGYISVLELKNKLGQTEFDILDRSRMVIALELYRQKIFFVEEERARSKFLNLLLEEKHVNEQIIKQDAEILGFKYDKPFLAIIIKFHFKKTKNDLRQIAGCSIDQDLTQTVIEILSQTDPNVFVVGRSDDIVIFYHTQSINDDTKTSEKNLNICKRIQDTIESMFNTVDTVIGLGRVDNNLSNLINSYKEAYEAIQISEKFCQGRKILDYCNLGYLRVLESEVRDERKAIKYCYDVMGKLIEHEEKCQSGFIETLYMFMEQNGSYQETARLSHMHVNTVQYRLKKIRKILCVDFDKMEGRMSLWLALNIHRYMKNKKGGDL